VWCARNPRVGARVRVQVSGRPVCL
jgi:hypothetical protein